MNNIVILNALNISEYAFTELCCGKSSVEYAVMKSVSMPDVSKRVVMLSPDMDSGPYDGLGVFGTAAVKPSDLVAALAELSSGFDNIIYYHADCALIDVQLTKKMYANHLRYFCEYTFADGYPAGLSVEIIKPEILSMLARLAEGDERPLSRNTIFSLIEKDINAFEIETEISPDDQRLLRVALYPDTKRNFIQLKSIFNSINDSTEGDNTATNVLDVVRAHGEHLRTLPAFYEFETTSSCPQEISYMPAAGGVSAPGPGEMSVDSFRKALQKISGFSDDAVISLSVRNEPSTHSAPAVLAESVLAYDKFNLLIETSGLGWDEAQLQAVLSMDQERITWIIDLDALDRELYRNLRGNGYDEAYAFAERLISLSPENVWVQVVRIADNEEDNERFYKYWKEKTNNVIIQKYDWCCGRLEQRKITDLSPLKRLPCWHLKRDMVILVDGRVPLCRDDLDSEFICGNILADDIDRIWKNGEDVYRRHLKEEYPGICRNCDEYYTYNY